jgi:pyruvate dehydrogenase E1 component alpha subunit
MDKEQLLQWYRQMVLIRRIEQRSAELYQQGKIGGFLHLYIGQEAVAVGSIAARQPGDHVITAYRDHGHALAVGSEPGRVIAELLGKSTGVSKGKGGSMHLADVERNYWGGHAVVGAHLSLAAGLALAEQYRGTNNAVLCYFGDGSSNIGYFHESLNLAGVWKLPVLWIAENNQYGMGTTIARASAVPRMIDKALGYGLDGKQVNGMNIFEVYEATKAALERIRSGGGPQFLEMLTYRFEGHSMGDPLRYRGDDPIGILERRILDEKFADKDALEAVDQKVEQTVEEAVRFAEESPLPAAEELFTNIFVEA